MPNNERIKAVDPGWTKEVLKTAGYTINKMLDKAWGLIPISGFVQNDAKYGVNLGELKYSEKELLRIASSWDNFMDRSDRVVSYLMKCNPHLKDTFGRMDLATKRMFYRRLKEDRQFNWCLNKYPEIELADSQMQPGLNGLHVSDSVTRDKFRNKYISSPLGGVIIWLLAAHNSGGNVRSQMDKAPSGSKPPIMGAEALGLTTAAFNMAANSALYGTYESHQLYTQQRAEEQAKKTSRLLKDNIDKLVSEHEDGPNLARGKKRGGGIVECVSIESDESPSAANSKTFRKIQNGQTGCTSVCGTQSETSVTGCLDRSRTPEFSAEDNDMCEKAGPFKSKNALVSEYTGMARRGVYKHERDWREDQKLEFNGECKDPSEGNFNAYPGGKADLINHEGGISDPDATMAEKFDSLFHKRFMSSGKGFQKKNCRFDEFPGPELEEDRPYVATNLKCEDSPQDPSDAVYSPKIKAISNRDLVTLMTNLQEALYNLGVEESGRCPAENLLPND